MSISNFIKVDRLQINLIAYSNRFPRDMHSGPLLKDRGYKFYFKQPERLTLVEQKTIEGWPSNVNDFFDRVENKDAKIRFLRCLCGFAEPETTEETIVVKLVYQALALGGLHSAADLGEMKSLKTPANDIQEMKHSAMRTFLLRVQQAMDDAWMANAEGDFIEEYNAYYDDYFDTGSAPDPRWSENEQLAGTNEESFFYNYDLDDYIRD